MHNRVRTFLPLSVIFRLCPRVLLTWAEPGCWSWDHTRSPAVWAAAAAAPDDPAHTAPPETACPGEWPAHTSAGTHSNSANKIEEASSCVHQWYYTDLLHVQIFLELHFNTEHQRLLENTRFAVITLYCQIKNILDY